MRRSLIALALLVGACVEPPERELGEMPYEYLSDYGFFVGDMVELEPAEGVVPYTVAAPLFSDFADKGRFIVLPEGEQATFAEGEGWQFPEGTIVIKTFFFDLDRRDEGGEFEIIETRLLIREADDWSAHTYVWNEEQTEAVRTIAGKDEVIEGVDANGDMIAQDYIVPDTNTCSACHGRDDRNHLLGVMTHQLNMEVRRDGRQVNQLEWLQEQGLFGNSVPQPSGLPALADPYGNGDLDARARAYLHANCAHCHRPGGGASASHLSFLAWEEDPARYGVCKISIAAGGGTGSRKYDIVPGYPEESIVPFRMASTEPEIKMPELTNLLPDERGVALVEEWIAAMEPKGCGDEGSTDSP